MKIGFDGRYAEGNLLGVGKYIKYLLQELDKLGIECVIFYSKNPKCKIQGENIKSVVLSARNRYIFEQIALPPALIREKVNIYHALGNVGIPLVCPVPAVLTIHDIIPLEIKDYFSYSPSPILSRLSYLSRLKSSIVKAKKIVTVSNYVKKEIIKKLGVPSYKINTIYSGRPVAVKTGALPANLKNQKYILNHGGMDIRKNLDKLIEAFALVYKKNPDIKLVITGENKRIRDHLDELIADLKLKGSVIFTGYIDDRILSAVIKFALLVCYPTISEGFGFPVLEGFRAGVPVISSNTSSIHEVAGNAAILVNPKNTIEISRAIEKCISDKKLRKTMISKGQYQYNKFNWKEAANEYFNLYNNI